MVVAEIVCDGVEFCLSINFDLIDLTFLDLFYLLKSQEKLAKL